MRTNGILKRSDTWRRHSELLLHNITHHVDGYCNLVHAIYDSCLYIGCIFTPILGGGYPRQLYRPWLVGWISLPIDDELPRWTKVAFAARDCISAYGGIRSNNHGVPNFMDTITMFYIAANVYCKLSRFIISRLYARKLWHPPFHSTLKNLVHWNYSLGMCDTKKRSC